MDSKYADTNQFLSNTNTGPYPILHMYRLRHISAYNMYTQITYTTTHFSEALWGSTRNKLDNISYERWWMFLTASQHFLSVSEFPRAAGGKKEREREKQKEDHVSIFKIQRITELSYVFL